MNSAPLSRRDFIATASTAAAAAALLPFSARAAQKSATPRWPVGCFNRPWTKWSYDDALDGIKAAGYQWTGLLSATPAKGEHLIGSAATPEYLASIKQKLAARGLKANMGALRVKSELPVDAGIADCRKQLVNAHTLGLESALTFGEARPERYATYHKIMADAAAFGQERGIKVVMKPHGGGSGSSDEILSTLKAVGHPNFKIWYDAGNIIHYTGKDPVADLAPIAEHVTGFCAKDCAVQKGEVMIQFGEGKVDFAGVFKKLKSAGFNGPIMVECCKIGATAQETTANARANREYLEKVLASV
ncbi:MAG TPA: sugar phosphate isomerase/epimerase [Opitutaceae bacterium]|nr:sugar phosphate isomerase/epimerase [Opitutaceae bacterium]